MNISDETIEAMAREFERELFGGARSNQAHNAVVRAMRAAVALIPQPPVSAAPEGWKLVPLDPSPEQIKAIEFAIYRYSDCSARDAERGAPYVYIAARTAAPTPPAESPQS